MKKFNFHFNQFDSVQALWEYAYREPTNSENKAYWLGYKDGRNERGKDWYGVADAAAVHATVKNGWGEGAKTIKAFAEKLKEVVPAPHSVRRRIKWADQGDSLDIHRVWSGRLDSAWESHPRQRSRGPQTVVIFSQIFQSVLTSSSYGFWRGAAVLTLADLLIEAGYNVEIKGGMLAAGALIEEDTQKDAYAFLVNIKPALAQIDTSSLAASLSLAGFFRVGFFMANCNYADLRNKVVDPSQGRLMYNDREYYKAVQEKIAATVGAGWDFDATDCGNEYSAAEWVKASIAKLQGSVAE